MKTIKRYIALLIAAVLLVALGATVSFWAIAQMEVAAEARNHTRSVIGKAEELLSGLLDAETGQRGYALTGDEAFLEPYLTGRERISGYLGDLRQNVRVQAGQAHLDALAPLIDAKLAELAQVIVLRQKSQMADVLALVKSTQGKRLMDAIRVEINALVQIEESALARLEQEYQSSLRLLFFIFLGVSLLALFSVLSFAYLIYSKSKERLKDSLHVETRRLLEIQEGMNTQLQQANNAALENEEKLSVTLSSIGDAVIATDNKARVTLLNPIAEQLTGWTQAEANGRPIDEVFHIINKETRLPATIPVMETLEHGTIQGLANHTVLIARDGCEYDISDSCAPIRNHKNELVGAVLVFRNVTEEYAVQHAFGLQQLELEMQNNELLQSRAALDASQARYFDLYDRAPVGYLTLSESGLIVEANASAAAMLNLDRDSPVKKSITRFVDQKDMETYYQLRQELMATGEPQACELRLRKYANELLWAHLSISSALDQGMPVLRMVMTDISARKQTEEALVKSGALQQAIFNSANFSSIATDANGVIQIFNVGAERMLGYAAADVMNKITPADISDPQEVIIRAEVLSVELETPISPGFEALVFKASRGIEDIYELTYIRKDGSRFPAVVSVTALRDEQNMIIGYLLIGTDNTARKAAEAALVKAGALQSAIFNSANFSSIATDANGVIQIFNVGAERMLGYAAADVMNKITPADISDPQEVITRAEALSVELETPISPGFEALVFKASRGIEDIYELTYIRKDGSRFPAVVSVTALRDEQNMIIGYLLIGTDNTARKAAEAALVKAGALQSAIFNSANFSSIATDANGVIQIFNVGAERMLGYAAADVMNKITPADISDPQEVIIRAEALSVELDTPISPGFEALVFKASRGIEDIYELTYIRKDGSRFPAVVSVTALRDDQNMIIGYLLIGTDNTARKLVEEERALLDLALKAKNVELENARDVADEANLAKSDFLSSMSHELRTPLGAILGFAQLIESGTPQPTPNQKRSVDQILKAGWYLLELINEILDLAVIESGKLSLSIESVSLAEVLHECEAMIEPQAEKRGISVVFAKLEEVYFVKADRIRVKQILINLLSNSIKYNKAGGTVTVMCSVCHPDSIQISVRDTGEGLSAEWLAQLFQPFNRLGQKANVEEGTGIGLVVCKRLVELMAGEIGVESTVGIGSVFWIKLKLTDEPKSTGHEDDAVVLDRLQNQGGEQRYTLLYVEDNPANLMLIEDIIARRLDIRLLSAKDGNAGVELARKALPDVILMDINLPGISGIKALEILANDSLTAHIPVIALSANALPRDIQRGLAAGFVGYLTKPIKIVEFMQTLDQALKRVDGKSAGSHIEEG